MLSDEKDVDPVSIHIAQSNLSRSQEKKGVGFHLTGYIYFNRGTYVFSGGERISFYLKACEVFMECVNCEFDTKTLAFPVLNQETRTYNRTTKINKKKSKLTGTSAAVKIFSSLLKGFSSSVTATLNNSINNSANLSDSATLNSKNIQHQSTRLEHASKNFAMWRLEADSQLVFSSQDDVSGLILGERLRSEDGLIAYVKYSNRINLNKRKLDKILVTVSFSHSEMQWIDPKYDPWWLGLKSRIPGLMEFTASSVEAKIAQLILKKALPNKILIGEV